MVQKVTPLHECQSPRVNNQLHHVLQRDSLEQAAAQLPTLTVVVAADKKVSQLLVYATLVAFTSRAVFCCQSCCSG